MFIEHEVYIGFRDVGYQNKITNTAMIAYLEDAGGIHSNFAGYGLNDIDRTKKSWMLLDWKIELYKRPKYADKIIIKTWSRKTNKIYAYRDFEIFNENRELIGIATSNWILYDIEKQKITRLGEYIDEAYQIEDAEVFENEKFEKLIEPENYIEKANFKVSRNLIDVNNHVHNIYYMDIANEVLPMDIYGQTEFNKIRIMYKKGIKLNENVNVYYNTENEKYIISIKSEDNKDLHSIIILEK